MKSFTSRQNARQVKQHPFKITWINEYNHLTTNLPYVYRSTVLRKKQLTLQHVEFCRNLQEMSFKVLFIHIASFNTQNHQHLTCVLDGQPGGANKWIILINTLKGCQQSGELDSTTPFPSGHVSYHRQHCTFLKSNK